jgi:hypothetical protein
MFSSGACAMWMPKVFVFMRDTFQTLKAKYPWLTLPFYASIWTSITVNFGPWSSTTEHRDVLNAAGVPCAIIAMGNFDPVKGGHLVLFDYRYAIEFPSGSVAHIISSSMRHANTPVATHEHRASVVQHMSGGLSRFIDSGYVTLRSLAGTALEAALQAAAPSRRLEVLSRFSTTASVVEDRNFVNGMSTGH